MSGFGLQLQPSERIKHLERRRQVLDQPRHVGSDTGSGDFAIPLPVPTSPPAG